MALSPEVEGGGNYYRYRDDQDDGGYLDELVETCQDVLKKTKHYDKIAPILHELACYYCDLQIHKHVKLEEREPRLQTWFEAHKENLPEMSWFEFSACAGSTLGIFCLVAYAFHDELHDEDIAKIRQGYFPYVQGLHILLDYFIDQEEDRIGGDLNFCSYYENEQVILDRMKHFVEEAEKSIGDLPHAKFHRLISRGLLGIYLSIKSISTKEYAQNGTAHCKIWRPHFTILLLEREDVPKENGAVMKKTTHVEWFCYNMVKVVSEMKRLFQKLYDNIEVTLLVLLTISFVTGMYMMMNRPSGPTMMDYVPQVIIGAIIIVDIVFLVSSRKNKRIVNKKHLYTRVQMLFIMI